MLFSSAHKIFTNVDHIQYHKVSLNRFKELKPCKVNSLTTVN